MPATPLPSPPPSLFRRRAKRPLFPIVIGTIHLPPKARHALHSNPLDDFEPPTARSDDHAPEATEADRTMMAVLSVCAVLEYGCPEGIRRRICARRSEFTHGHDASRPISSRAPRPELRSGDSLGFDSSSDCMRVDTVAEADPEEIQHDRMVDVSVTLSGPLEALSTSNGPSNGSDKIPHTLYLALRLV